MNFRQRRMLTAVGFAMAVVILWPPYNVHATPGRTELRFVWLFSGIDGTIHTLLLIAEIVALALIGFVAHRLFAEEQ